MFFFMFHLLYQKVLIHLEQHLNHYFLFFLIISTFLLQYNVSEMSITAPTLINIMSETFIGMLYQIICVTIMVYSKTVVSFPCQSAPCTSPLDLILKSPVTPITVSFTAIKIKMYNIFGNLLTKQSKMAACVNLSATGSRIFPKSEIILISAAATRRSSDSWSPMTGC